MIAYNERCLAKFKVDKDNDTELKQSVLFTLELEAIRLNGGGVQFFAQPQLDGKCCRLCLHYGSDFEVREISQEAIT